jgi:hypothetical protein
MLAGRSESGGKNPATVNAAEPLGTAAISGKYGL